MNTHTERFLGFAFDKQITEEGFYYEFKWPDVGILAEDSELTLTISYDGRLIARYTQYDELDLIVEAEKSFDSESVKVPELLTWLKSIIK